MQFQHYYQGLHIRAVLAVALSVACGQLLVVLFAMHAKIPMTHCGEHPHVLLIWSLLLHK
jgi:hypothetical protein